jgi:hypothetical protein
MSLPSYIANNHEELFDSSSTSTQDLILNGEVDTTAMTLGANYKIPVSKQTALADTISYILVGALQPDDVVEALQDMVDVTSEEAIKIAEDLEHSILEKARISLFTKSGVAEVKTLEFQGQKSKEELRKEILDTTKRESGINKNQATPADPKKTTVIAPGSRSQLLEQLQVLSTIPNDEEITDRLKHIQEQIGSLKKQEEDHSLTSKIALKSFMFGEKGKETADPTIIRTTYSVAPEKYNVDPYRELAEE